MKPYACHNRPPFRTVAPMQDGWWLDGETRTPRMTAVPFRMSHECNYSRDPMGYGVNDPRCEGCRWRAEPTKE